MKKRAVQPLLLPARPPGRFPDPNEYDAEGLVAVGGDLEPERLLLAYRSGVLVHPPSVDLRRDAWRAQCVCAHLAFAYAH